VTVLWYFAIGFWAVLLGRRLQECLHFEQFLASLRLQRNTALESDLSKNWPHLIVFLPLFQEQVLLEQILEHFAQLLYPRDRIQILLITTQKEKTAGPTTRQRIDELLPDVGYQFTHLHYPVQHQFRAAQLNFALERVETRAAPSETFIGVYNADSLPDIDSLILLAKDAALFKQGHGAYPCAYQQPVRYFVPERHDRSGEVMHSAAAFQTLWTMAHFARRLLKAEKSARADRRGPYTKLPVSFLGHGEFIRLDVLREVGCFPDQAYGDGLLLGWILVLKGFPIRVLPAFDHCEVPPHWRALIRQHAAWFLALWNLGTAVRITSTVGSRRRNDWGVCQFVLIRVLASVTWGLRSVVILVVFVIGSLIDTSTLLFGLIGVIVYAAIPIIFLTLCHPLLASAYAYNSVASKYVLFKRIVASIPALFIDGTGFWVMLALRIRKFGIQITPEKTER
jgi:hypothetical protein